MVSQIFLFSRQMNLLEEFAANVGATKSIKNKFINNEFLTSKAGKNIHSDCFFSFCLSDKLNQTPNRFPNLKVKRRKFFLSRTLSLPLTQTPTRMYTRLLFLTRMPTLSCLRLTLTDLPADCFLGSAKSKLQCE